MSGPRTYASKHVKILLFTDEPGLTLASTPTVVLMCNLTLEPQENRTGVNPNPRAYTSNLRPVSLPFSPQYYTVIPFLPEARPPFQVALCNTSTR